MRISEIFGLGTENSSPAAKLSRDAKICPFRGSSCTKSSTEDPLGVCSLSDGTSAAALCPVRFLQNDLIFKDAARLAFGAGVQFGVFPEIRVLKVAVPTSKDRKIGKVDYLLGKIENGVVVDFAAVEVQAVYFSGDSIRPPFLEFLKSGILENADRRPDFRSSAQKRLMPQLELKVPIFRRWGKKFFVVIDTHFYRELPTFKASSPSNSELVWLVYELGLQGVDYELKLSHEHFSQWDDVRTSLREGVPPEPEEITQELQEKLIRTKGSARILTS